ncbi:MAG TPA: Fic family protein [Gammaproteobacteria bacterium]|nr:Fic family protein [Gammaproteobacteria bacterium]
MSIKKPDIKADINQVIDREENPSLMEPLLVSESSPQRASLVDLTIELAAKSAGFKRSLPPMLHTALANMVRAMNCYYSNLIEGHNTHPLAIERALQGDYSSDKKKRDLQLEAKAHIIVQQWIDMGGLKNRAFTQAAICEIHQRFCSLLPTDLLWITDLDDKNKIKIVPGKFRQQDVVVGRHVPISAGAIPRFLSRFESFYSRLGKVETILAAAAAHHRLLWIHPFLDGNGRVARLMSYAVLLDALDSGGIWSIARGLARRESEYKTHLAHCNLQRRNDLDGRGHLSEEALIKFIHFFMEICLDQINFMENLMQPEGLRTRILLWAKEEIALGKLPPQAEQILDIILYRGELPRKDIPSMLGVTDRHARRITAALIERHVLVSTTPKSPLTLAFPAALAGRWMPGLFPEHE